MKRLAAILLWCALAVSSWLSLGCSSIVRGAVEQPYRDALREGRMPPSEYMKMRDEIWRASQSEK